MSEGRHEAMLRDFSKQEPGDWVSFELSKSQKNHVTELKEGLTYRGMVRAITKEQNGKTVYKRLENKRIVSEERPGDTWQIELDLEGRSVYLHANQFNWIRGV